MPAGMNYHDYKRVYVDKSLTLKDWQEKHSGNFARERTNRMLQAAAVGGKIQEAAKTEKNATPLKLSEAFDTNRRNYGDSSVMKWATAH